MTGKNHSTPPSPHPLIAAIPLLTLIGMVSLVVTLFGSDSLSGGSQIALLLSTAVCVGLSMAVYRQKWEDFETSVKKTLGGAAVSIVILLVIGMLSGAWMISGVVPTMIYYGIKIMTPSIFLLSTCVICAMVSVITGSSWTTIATIGVALLGIGDALSFPPGWTAGAIISGAYFGDKISPLSDTTVLAASSADTKLFTHIRYMLYTTIPTFTIACTVFLCAGFFMGSKSAATEAQYTDGLAQAFNISAWTLIVPALTAVMIAKRVPSLITLFISSLAAGIMSLILQPEVLIAIAGDSSADSLTLIKGMMMSFFDSTQIDTGNENLNSLVSTGGMSGMLPTVWLILCAMTFGGCMVASGMLHSLMNVVLRRVRRTASLVAAAVGTGFSLNVITSDQYISIIMTASMYKDSFHAAGLENRLLSRTTEDAATVTSVLIPWNTCGMTQATVLGVPTLTYLPYCVFNYLSPLMSILVAAIGWKVVKKSY